MMGGELGPRRDDEETGTDRDRGTDTDRGTDGAVWRLLLADQLLPHPRGNFFFLPVNSTFSVQQLRMVLVPVFRCYDDPRPPSLTKDMCWELMLLSVKSP